MDVTQILITVGSVIGIVLVALVAIVPTLMEIPPAERPAPRVRSSTAKPPVAARAGELHLPA